MLPRIENCSGLQREAIEPPPKLHDLHQGQLVIRLSSRSTTLAQSAVRACAWTRRSTRLGSRQTGAK